MVVVCWACLPKRSDFDLKPLKFRFRFLVAAALLVVVVRNVRLNNRADCIQLGPEKKEPVTEAEKRSAQWEGTTREGLSL